MSLIYVFALGAALCFGVGAVVQQRAASHAPPQDVLRFALLLWLVRRPLWLAGVGTAVVGNVLSANALALGTVALVGPLLVSRLLFALGVGAVWMRQRVSGRDWVAAAATAGGLGLFIAVGRPEQEGVSAAAPLSWVITGLGVLTAAGLLTRVARRAHPVREAALLAAAAGLLFGLQAALTQATVEKFTSGGVTAALTSWAPYAVAVVALLGTVLLQSAYELAPLPASFPSLVSAEPLASVAIGVGVLGGTLHLEPAALAGELAGFAVMLLGIRTLASSPMVTGQAERMRRRQEEGLVVRCAERLEGHLRRLASSVSAAEEHPGRPSWRTRRRLARELTVVRRELTRLGLFERRLEELEAEERARGEAWPGEPAAQWVDHAERRALEERAQAVSSSARRLLPAA